MTGHRADDDGINQALEQPAEHIAQITTCLKLTKNAWKVRPMRSL